MPLVPLANGIQSLFGELERSARARSSLITRSGTRAALFNQPFAYLPMYSKFSFDVKDYKSAVGREKKYLPLTLNRFAVINQIQERRYMFAGDRLETRVKIIDFVALRKV